MPRLRFAALKNRTGGCRERRGRRAWPLGHFIESRFAPWNSRKGIPFFYRRPAYPGNCHFNGDQPQAPLLLASHQIMVDPSFGLKFHHDKKATGLIMSKWRSAIRWILNVIHPWQQRGVTRRTQVAGRSWLWLRPIAGCYRPTAV